jgi:modulator of FtsH protease HflC
MNLPYDRRRLIQIGVAAFAVIVILANSLYVVGQRQQALVVRFGEPVRVVNAFNANSPGLKLKVPFLENVIKFDKRLISQEAEQEEIITADQERLVVDAFIRYRIEDPLQFYRTLRNEQTALLRLDTLVNSSLRQILGSASSNDIISNRRGALMRLAQQDVAARARQSRFGIAVMDVRIKRADLPEANQAAVFNRMRTSRQQEAAQIRSFGEQQKREIIATADKDVAITLATATQEAEKVRGEGDSQRAATFNAAFGRDPSFASFYRSMRAYETALGKGDTTMVLSPDSAFFRYFENGPGGGR